MYAVFLILDLDLVMALSLSVLMMLSLSHEEMFSVYRGVSAVFPVLKYVKEFLRPIAFWI